jgi:DNA-binding XRE family transcriptional regulator
MNGNDVANAREKLQVTQQFFADLVCVSQPTICRWEKTPGEVIPQEVAVRIRALLRLHREGKPLGLNLPPNWVEYYPKPGSPPEAPPVIALGMTGGRNSPRGSKISEIVEAIKDAVPNLGSAVKFGLTVAAASGIAFACNVAVNKPQKPVEEVHANASPGNMTAPGMDILEDALTTADVLGISRAIPDHPFSNQETAPCKYPHDVEIKGGCYVKVSNAPCPASDFEYGGACYMAHAKLSKPSGSALPALVKR